MERKRRTRPRNLPSRESPGITDSSATPNIFIRLIDPVVVFLITLIIQLGELKSRDPLEDPHRALRPDQEIQSRLKNWREILDWPPGRRVGWFVGVALGIAAGGTFLWYMLQDT